MSGQHTTGRLVVESSAFSTLAYIDDESGMTVANGVDAAHARRLAACWNALEDMTTEDIEAVSLARSTANDMLRQAVREHAELVEYRANFRNLEASYEDARALLAELVAIEGPQPGNANWAEKVNFFLSPPIRHSGVREFVPPSSQHSVSAVKIAAEDVVRHAARNGMVLTITQRPRFPLTQGNYDTVVEVRPVLVRGAE